MKKQKAKSKKQKFPLKREFSAGCVVFKRLHVTCHMSHVLFLIGKHSGYHQWVLPKGLIEKGEHGFETALRETEEEMGVKAKLISKKPIHKVQYFYVADYKNENSQNSLNTPKSPRRRIAKYQEAGGQKTKVFKVVSFYLAEYLSGDPKKHGWEMEEAAWYQYEKAKNLLAFPGEKQALEKAQKILRRN